LRVQLTSRSRVSAHSRRPIRTLSRENAMQTSSVRALRGPNPPHCPDFTTRQSVSSDRASSTSPSTSRTSSVRPRLTANMPTASRSTCCPMSNVQCPMSNVQSPRCAGCATARRCSRSPARAATSARRPCTWRRARDLWRGHCPPGMPPRPRWTHPTAAAGRPDDRNSVGTDHDPAIVYWKTLTASNYTDSGVGGVNTIRADTGWTGSARSLRPAQLAHRSKP